MFSLVFACFLLLETCILECESAGTQTLQISELTWRIAQLRYCTLVALPNVKDTLVIPFSRNLARVAHAQNFSTCRLLHRGSQQTSNHVCQLKLAWDDPWTGQSWSKFIDCPDSCAADLYIPLHSPYFNLDADSDHSVLAFIKQRHCLSITIILGSFKLRFIHQKVVETLVTYTI